MIIEDLGRKRRSKAAQQSPHIRTPALLRNETLSFPQSETEALERDRGELEGVRECALEEAHAIQRERMELEEEKAALGAEVDSVQEAARHAQVCA